MRFKILDHRAEIFRLVRRRGGQGVADFAGPGLRHHRPVGQALVIVGEPVDELMAVAAEVFRRHERPCGLAGLAAGACASRLHQAVSASGVATGREQVCPGTASRSAPPRAADRRAASRSAIAVGRGAARSVTGSGARSAACGERLGRRIVERAVDDDRAAARQHVGAHERQRAAAEPFGQRRRPSG